jgi:hypothetical protein
MDDSKLIPAVDKHINTLSVGRHVRISLPVHQSPL